MIDRSRIPLAILAAATLALIPVAVLTQSGPANDWKLGDIFAGVGRYNVLSGQYLVFNADGTRKVVTNPNGSTTPATVVDPTAGLTGTTTGCMIAPPSLGNALYTTSFFNRSVARFNATAPHAGSTVATVTVPPIEAVESIVADRAGNYYLGAMAPQAESSSDPRQPYGFIVKLDAANNRLATYEVPNGTRGANWIDLGTDQQTLYYTSEDTTIHVYRPGPSRGAADNPIHHFVPGQDFYQEIPIMAGDARVEGTVYALRLLPPIPGDPLQRPSGYLVAQYWRVLRLDPQGQILQQYVDESAGSFFALNITPDGRSFWTAKYVSGDPDWRDYCVETNGKYAPGGSQADPDWTPDQCTPLDPAGTLAKFNIASGALEKGPIQTGAENVWGLCVIREYTAAVNTCYALDAQGNAIPGTNGNPIEMPCLPPPDCTVEASNPLCAPLPPVLGNPGTVTIHTGEPAHVTLPVRSPLHIFYTVTAAGLPAGLGAPIEVGSSLNYTFDLTGTPTAVGSYPVSVCLNNPGLAAPVCQAFTLIVTAPALVDRCTCSAARASPSRIWPPTAKKTTIAIANLADVNGAPLAVKILGIYQDEPTSYGDASTPIDGGGIGTSQAWVRAERTGNPGLPGTGRVYEVAFEATAADGSTCRGAVFTGVPLEEDGAIVDNAVRYDSTVAGGPIVRQAMTVTPGLTDADLAAQAFMPVFVAEARLGTATTHEVSLGADSTNPAKTANLTWSNGGTAGFLLAYDGSQAVFTLLGPSLKILTYAVSCENGQCDDLFLRARSGAGSSITVSDLNLNGRAIAEPAIAAGAGGVQNLGIRGASLSRGFLLYGKVKMTWLEAARPPGDDLGLELLLGHGCHESAAPVPTNHAPAALADSYAATEDTVLSATAASQRVLVNDTDPDGDALTAILVSQPAHGTVVLASNGSVVYTPAANFNGVDAFTYKASDGALTSAAATVTITVAAVNDPPVAVADSYQTLRGTALTVPGTGILGNDTDPDGTAGLKAVLVSSPAHGTLTLSSAGSFTYTPASGFTGTDTFTYKVKDPSGVLSGTATVTIAVKPHADGDGCDHDRHAGGHRDRDHDDHDWETHGSHTDGDRCDHDRKKNGHHTGDGCEHEKYKR